MTMARAPSVSAELADSWTTASTDGVAIRLYAWKTNRGGRPAVIWGHANGFATGAYAAVLQDLSAAMDVFAMDLRGHGGSGDPGPDYDVGMTADRFAFDLMAATRSIRQRAPTVPLHFAGHSASGLGALRMGAVFGHAPFVSITLFEPPLAPSPDHPLHADAALLGEALAKRALRRKRVLPDPESFAASLETRPAFDRWRPDMLRAFAAATLAPAPDGDGWRLICSPEAEASVYRMTMDTSTFTALSTFRRPILFVESDPAMQGVAPSWAAKAQGAAVLQAPMGRLTRIDGASHMMPFERPDAVVEIVHGAVARS